MRSNRLPTLPAMIEARLGIGHHEAVAVVDPAETRIHLGPTLGQLEMQPRPGVGAFAQEGFACRKQIVAAQDRPVRGDSCIVAVAVAPVIDWTVTVAKVATVLGHYPFDPIAFDRDVAVAFDAGVERRFHRECEPLGVAGVRAHLHGHIGALVLRPKADGVVDLIVVIPGCAGHRSTGEADQRDHRQSARRARRDLAHDGIRSTKGVQLTITHPAWCLEQDSNLRLRRDPVLRSLAHWPRMDL
jgi:hypothetical protein